MAAIKLEGWPRSDWNRWPPSLESAVTWNATLASLPPAAVEREIASEMALSNYLAFQNFKLAMKHTAIGATQLAETAEHDFMPTVRMAAPAMVSN